MKVAVERRFVQCGLRNISPWYVMDIRTAHLAFFVFEIRHGTAVLNHYEMMFVS
jgi:hypothetical protein